MGDNVYFGNSSVLAMFTKDGSIVPGTIHNLINDHNRLVEEVGRLVEDNKRLEACKSVFLDRIKELAEMNARPYEENKWLCSGGTLFKDDWLREKSRADKLKAPINDVSILIGEAGEILAESDDHTEGK
jgi:hypothetical protein